MENRLRQILLKNYRVNYPQDLILTGIPISVADTCYKYKLIQQRIGEAWDVAPTFYGWTKADGGIDIKNDTSKQAAEVKNCNTSDNSSSRRRNYDKLLEFKQNNPEYEILYVVLNDKSDKDTMKDNGRIRYVSGIHALRILFGEDSQEVVAIMKRLVTEFLTSSHLATTDCD